MPGVALLELSLKKLLLISLPPWLSLFVVELPMARWNSGLLVFIEAPGENGEPEAERARLAGRSWLLKLLLRGVERW